LSESRNAIIWDDVKAMHADCRLGEFCLFKSEIVDLNRAHAVEALLMNSTYEPMRNSLFGELLEETKLQCQDHGWSVEKIFEDEGYRRKCFTSFALGLGEKLTRFDTWLGSSLVEWSSLQDMLVQAQQSALEVTFDMNIMTFFNRAMILHDCLPIWRERKSMASSRWAPRIRKSTARFPSTLAAVSVELCCSSLPSALVTAVPTGIRIGSSYVMLWRALLGIC
jgi:hypothetical protein